MPRPSLHNLPLPPACTSAWLPWFLPFDAVRQQHAWSVKAGWTPRSLLASARLERWLDTLEQLSLGPLARQR